MDRLESDEMSSNDIAEMERKCIEATFKLIDLFSSLLERVVNDEYRNNYEYLVERDRYLADITYRSYCLFKDREAGLPSSFDK